MDLGDSDTLTIDWTPDDVARNCEYVSSISVTDSNDNAYDYLTVTHTGETFTTSGTSTVTGDASTSITAQNSDIGSYTVTYTIADTSNSAIFKTTTVNLRIDDVDACTPLLDISQINISDSYSYQRGATAYAFVDLTNYSC